MRKIHYYVFPEGVPGNVRFANGAEGMNYSCTVDPERFAKLDNPSEGCPHRDGSKVCGDCSNIICAVAHDGLGGISIAQAKELLTEFGGHAYTRRITRDGDAFDVRPIKFGKGASGRVKRTRLRMLRRPKRRRF